MILINSGKMTIPEEERFIGFAGDNLHSTKQFLVSGVADENCIYRLYLTFDDGTTNYFVLDSKVEKDSTILNWTILEEHIFKSGMVEAQIKSISADGEVYHTSSDYFFVAYSAELSDEFKGNENAEFLRYEKELNELLKKLESGAHDCVKENRTIARLPLSDDIEDVELMRALSVYPVFLTDVGPEEFNISGIGTGQFRLVQRSDTDDTCTLYNYRGVDENGKNIWLKVACDSEVSDEQISAAVDKYLSKNPIGDTGADGKSAYQIALDNGFEGTQSQWLDSLKGEDGEDGISPSITVSKTDGGTVLNIVSDAGIQKATILNGVDGNDGTSISIDNINESADDDGNNIITFSDGNTLSIKNGSKGTQGEKGETGEQGEKGEKGDKGETGSKGDDGYTPIKGVDYYTEDEKAQLVNEVIDTMNSADAITVYETVGGYYSTDGSFIEDENFSCKHTDIICVEKNERFSYTGCGLWSAASVLWYDENSVLVSASQYGEWDNEATLEITVPSGVSYARFCSFANVGEVVFSISRLESDTIHSVLKGKKIVYDGDSICYGAGYKGGYAKLLAEAVYGSYENMGIGGGRLVSAGNNGTYHSVVDNLSNLPTDGDLYCFEGGINDYWTEGVSLGTFDYENFDGALDVTTVCGALETIFRYALNNFIGKPVCFIITHKIQKTAYSKNSDGDTFKDYHDTMVGICQKYSIPYYDAFYESGLNGFNTVQNNTFLTGNSSGIPDGCHPNEEGYKRYYVPQLKSLFEKIMPEQTSDVDLPSNPSYTNLLEDAGYTKGIYLSSGNESSDANAYTTGYIPCSAKSTVYLKNITMPDESGHGNRIGLYKSDKSVITGYPITSSQTAMSPVFDENGNLSQFYVDVTDLAYIRISAWNIDDTSIITVNEPIE